MKVDYLDVGGEPNRCFADVERMVAEQGGEAVYGWVVTDYPRTHAREYVHHVCWRDADGHLWHVTPLKGYGADGLEVTTGPIEFQPDPIALPTGEKPHRRTLPTRYEPLTTDPLLAEVCRLLGLSEQAHTAGDTGKAQYWTDKANRVAGKLGWSIPDPTTTKAEF